MRALVGKTAVVQGPVDVPRKAPLWPTAPVKAQA
jgi:hypothetical protein